MGRMLLEIRTADGSNNDDSEHVVTLTISDNSGKPASMDEKRYPNILAAFLAASKCVELSISLILQDAVSSAMLNTLVALTGKSKVSKT